MDRVDQKFAEVQSAYPAAFACRTGCFGCCKSGLTVRNIEAEHIRAWLFENPTVVSSLKNEGNESFWGEEYCKFLDEKGGCSIYKVRPIVCRSHGAPTLIPAVNEDGDDMAELEADVCPLNFQDMDLGQLESKDWIRLDTLNLILSAVDREYDEKKLGNRVSLDPKVLANGII